MDRLRPDAPTALLAVAIAASSALLLALGANLTFFQDTWAFLLEREGGLADRLLEPHNEHIVVIPAGLQELAIEWFGASSDMPSRVALTAMLAGTALLLFVYVRRRVGPWPALFAATVLLFLGSGWENLLWPFQISLVGSMLAGLGMLLTLERGDRRGDVAACILLAASIASSSLGLSFAAGAAADVLMRGRRRGLRRAWIVIGPLLLFGAWYLGYGRDAESAVSLQNLLGSPLFVLESAAASTVSILGLRVLSGGLDGGAPVGPMIAVAALAAGLAAWAWLRGGRGMRADLVLRRPSPLWPAAATAFSFWFLAALNEAPGRSPFAARYMYVGAVLVIIVAAALFAGARIGRRALAVGGAIAALAVAANLALLLDGYDRLERESVLTRADLGALEIAARTVPPGFRLDPGTAGTASLINVSAGPYLELVAEHGSPAYDPSELAAAPEAGRRQADLVLARALPVRGVPARGTREACRALGPGERAMPPGGGLVLLRSGPPATVSLRRFAPAGEAPVVIGELPGGAAATLAVPRDSAMRPWMLRLTPVRPARICPRAASRAGI